MNNLFTDKHIYSVSELTSDLRKILEDSFPNLWVEGEISTLRIPQSGHMYFTLKDEKAQLKCVFFKRANMNLNFKLEEGLSCIISGRISVYDQAGQYQLYVEKIEPKGKGALGLAFEQLKKKLAAEGLFEESRKRPIPFLAQRIGIVTSSTGAAIRDILQTLNRRYSNVQVIIRPSLVQGKTAAEDIAQGIKDLNAYKEVDVIIVSRGGGSLEDLWPFNEEVVARAVFNSKIPVISAVGHEIDYTICDFAADLRAPTPTAAAELVVPEKKQLAETVYAIQNRLTESMRQRLKLANMRFSRVTQSYALRRPQVIVEQFQQRLDNADKSINISFKTIVERIRQKVEALEKSLELNLLHLVTIKEGEFKQLSARLLNLNPLSILARGYSVTYLMPGHSVLKSVEDVKPGDILETKLNKGVIISCVEEFKK